MADGDHQCTALVRVDDVDSTRFLDEFEKVLLANGFRLEWSEETPAGAYVGYRIYPGGTIWLELPPGATSRKLARAVAAGLDRRLQWIEVHGSADGRFRALEGVVTANSELVEEAPLALEPPPMPLRDALEALATTLAGLTTSAGTTRTLPIFAAAWSIEPGASLLEDPDRILAELGFEPTAGPGKVDPEVAARLVARAPAMAVRTSRGRVRIEVQEEPVGGDVWELSAASWEATRDSVDARARAAILPPGVWPPFVAARRR